MTSRGFTLIETMFVTLLFPMLMLSVYAILDISSTIFRTNGIYSELNEGSMQSLRYISREIGQTSPLANPSHLTIAAGAGGNNIVTFQIPVDWDNDGDAVTAALNPVVEWVAYDQIGQTQNGRLSGWIRYTVVNNQLVRQVLDAGLNPIANLQQVVANNAQTFTAALNQNQKTLTMTLTLQRADRVGQKGAQQRVLQSTFTSRTILRNAVS